MIQFSSLDGRPLDQPSPSVLVPTMGALHEGHAALIRRGREIAGHEGKVTVSIFLNPKYRGKNLSFDILNHSIKEFQKK